MRIVADENIADVQLYFGSLGELILAPGRQINRNMVQDADILLVRSVTRVDAALLQGSRCRFVGTCTSGIDHIDTRFLAEAGITFAAARGCNAEAVADYVCSALAALTVASSASWTSRSIGIVGCGEVGSRLARRCLALGMDVAIHDPFLAPNHPLQQYSRDYASVLQHDIISFHTPLTSTGAHPTQHMLGAAALATLSPEVILINAARGAVVDNRALLVWLQQHPAAQVVLDVWEGEPALLPGLLDRVALGTAHIAGYTIEGKLRGTQMVHQALCEFLQAPQTVTSSVMEEAAGMVTGEDLQALVLSAYDIRRDDQALRQVAGQPDADRAFDHLRKTYPPRREFSAWTVDATATRETVGTQAAALGFSRVS
jgi:erythronate-4-phosphate dehydrogenase